MRHLYALSFSLALITGASAQTHFYIDEIAVIPAAPTTADNVSIQLIGNLSDGGAYIQSVVTDVSGFTVEISMVAQSNGGISVLIPHTETIFLGQLAAGTYTIEFTDATTGVLDSAPPWQHVFTVTGGGGPCADLELVSIGWQAFTDTALIVHVANNSSELFDYPRFILFNAQGDTLAKETVFYFGIAPQSWHTLRIVDGMSMPMVPFAGRLELWTNFTSELACVWESTFELCPPPPCTTIHPTVANMTGGEILGTFQWTVWDDVGVAGSGQLMLTAGQQFASGEICLPPGSYHIDVAPIGEVVGNMPHYYMSAPGGQATHMLQVSPMLPVLLPFTLLGPCISGTQSIAERPSPGLHTAPAAGGLQVWTSDESALGPVWLFDAQGRLLFSTQAFTDRLFVPIPIPGVYLLRAGERTVKVVGGVE